MKYAFRQLVHRPASSLTVILMLALGIGATTAIFSLFHQVLVQPLPVPEPERLVNILPAGQMRGSSLSYAMFRDLEARQDVFTGIAAHNPMQASVAYRGDSFSVPGAFVSGSYFEVLRLQPAAGRLIGVQDEPRVDESAVVVLSHAFWQSRFGGDPDVVGQALTVNGRSLTIVGVAPERFGGTQLGVRAQLFVPMTMRWVLDPSMPRESIDNRRMRFMFLFARLRPQLDVAQASARINATHTGLLNELEAPSPDANEEEIRRFREQRIDLLPGARGQGEIAGAGQSLTVLLGVTLLVLLIICVNIANLLLVRGASRAGEFAIRAAIGAGRGRLVTQLLIEAAVPAAIGGALALPVAVATLGAVMPMLPPRLAEGLAVQIGWEAALIALLITGSTLIVFAMLPALRTSRSDPSRALKGHAAQAVGGCGAARLRGALGTAQIAFSMVLLALAGLFAQSLANVARIDLGIDVDSLVSFNVAPRRGGYDAERTVALYDRIEQALAAQPGVTGVTSAAVPVIAGADFRASLFVEGFDSGGEPVEGSFNIVGPEFFETLSIPLLAGREFTADDVSSSARVAIVNERFARNYGLDDTAIGRRLRGSPNDDESLEIVGVVADAAYSAVKGEVPAQFFVPLSRVEGEGLFSFLAGSVTFYVRAGIDPDALLRTLPAVVASVDPTLPVGNVVTLRRQAQENIFVDRLVTVLSVGFAGLATLLAAIGLYGMLSYSVAQRTRELGLRLALGAEPADIGAIVMRQIGTIAAVGIAIGLVGAVGAGRAAEALLFGVSGYEPLVLVAAAIVLGAVVFVAGYLPARRAARIAPMEALRYE